MPETEFTTVYEEKFDELCRHLDRKFQRFDRATCEDLAQRVYLETLKKIRHDDFQPENGWWNWLRWLASKRALDYLRLFEREAMESLSPPGEDSSRGGWQPAVHNITPSDNLAQAERRGRQVTLMSDVFQEFCRHCETKDQESPQKEAYERTLRGQKPVKISEAMGISRSHVDVLVKRARDWFHKRIDQVDGNDSALNTLRRLWQMTTPRTRETLALQPNPIDQQSDSIAPDPARPQIPQFQSLGEVCRWVIKDLGGMCPSLERLTKYRRQHPGSTELSDVRYHVEEAGCHLCREDLSTMP
ncbi:sigma-70 family RNA polymerase sigma factor [Planctomycetaceae bacterium]|nr:sigma-70 family RNA polymerase sigma factor [Planctomycetaceae bacterium]